MWQGRSWNLRSSQVPSSPVFAVAGPCGGHAGYCVHLCQESVKVGWVLLVALFEALHRLTAWQWQSCFLCLHALLWELVWQSGGCHTVTGRGPQATKQHFVVKYQSSKWRLIYCSAQHQLFGQIWDCFEMLATKTENGIVLLIYWPSDIDCYQ